MSNEAKSRNHPTKLLPVRLFRNGELIALCKDIDQARLISLAFNDAADENLHGLFTVKVTGTTEL